MSAGKSIFRKLKRFRINPKLLHGFSAIILIAVVIYVVVISFTGLRQNREAPNAKTLQAVANPYSALVPRAMLCDVNGKPLMANVAVDRNGYPQLQEDGSYRLYADLDEEQKPYFGRQRMILADASFSPYCMSNVLPDWSGGLDSSYGSLLRMISTEHGETEQLLLTIDSDLQNDVYQVLNGRKRASAVVMNLNTGDILAMASTPSYNYNQLANDAVPFTRYNDKNGNGHFNIDNAHDCVEDFYKQWKSAVREDNQVTKLDEAKADSYVTDGSSVKTLRNKLKSEFFLLERNREDSRLDAETVLKSWQTADYRGAAMNLDTCQEYCFEEILRKEWNEGMSFQFDEPEGLGNGNEFIPFVKVKFSPDERDWMYLRITYGANNFIYQDCLDYGFDPNFSFTNFNTVPSAPGSTFKILLASMLVDQAVSLRSGSGEQTQIDLTCQKEPMDVNEYPQPLPSFEAYAGIPWLANLQDALKYSSNQYFSMAAMNMEGILNGNVRHLEFQNLANISDESSLRSAQLVSEFYRDVFCLNQNDLEIDFNLNTSEFFPYFEDSRIESGTEVYSNGLYRILRNDKNEYEGCGFNRKKSLQKMLGDTAYGMGEDMITPIHMAMSLGKILTGKMLLPNLLKEDSEECIVCGKPFSRSDTTEIMGAHLSEVFAKYAEDRKSDIKTMYPNLTFYAKTGTSSIEKLISGTQGAYGMIAERATDIYTVTKDRTYEQIWFSGAVSDQSGNTYAIVLRSYFDSGSDSLIAEFKGIVDALYDSQNKYLITNKEGSNE